MKRILATTAMGAAALILCQCEGKSIDMHNAQKTYTAPDDAMAFDVKLELTPAAMEHVQSIAGSLVITSSYYGLPTQASMPRANQLHEIDLGEERIGVAAGTASLHMTGALDRSQLKDIVDGVPYVMVSGYAVGKGGAASDGLSCRSYRNSVVQAKANGATVRCDIATPD